MRAASKDKRKRLRRFRELARQRQGGLCFYCRLPMAKVGSPEAVTARVETVEHRRPKCRGGTDAPANLVLTCRACNGLKASMTEAAFLAHLAATRPPGSEPPGS